MNKTAYTKQLKDYMKQAYEHYSYCQICPTGEEVVDFVCDCVENESGVDVDNHGYLQIAKLLGIEVDND